MFDLGSAVVWVSRIISVDRSVDPTMNLKPFPCYFMSSSTQLTSRGTPQAYTCLGTGYENGSHDSLNKIKSKDKPPKCTRADSGRSDAE
jgi:hypothetical protein